MARVLASDLQISIHKLKKFIENFKLEDFDFEDLKWSCRFK